MKWMMTKTCRLASFCFGVFNIKQTFINVNPKKYPKLKFCNKDESRITVSNHVSFLDILIYMSIELGSFISKKMVL